MEEELLTIRTVANRLQVDASTVRRWITLGKIDAIALPQVGERTVYRVKKSALDRILHNSIHSSAAPISTPVNS